MDSKSTCSGPDGHVFFLRKLPYFFVVNWAFFPSKKRRTICNLFPTPTHKKLFFLSKTAIQLFTNLEKSPLFIQCMNSFFFFSLVFSQAIFFVKYSFCTRKTLCAGEKMHISKKAWMSFWKHLFQSFLECN